jgi:heme-dependent oxidative N-demethylase alpha subunit-like protein
MSEILQTSLPYDPFTPKALPGISAFDMQDWLHVDDAFSGQMAERTRLLASQRDAVLALGDSSVGAAQELLDVVLDRAYDGARDSVTRPDGVSVTVDRNDPLGTLGHLVQEDLCILQKTGDEHVLTGAVLCFPASWTLSEKFMRPLIGIHDTVDEYDAGIAKRVQRLFDGVQVGQPLWRFNAFWYADPKLYQPHSVDTPRKSGDEATAPYFRSERQCIFRLPNTRAVVFSIHTYVLARDCINRMRPGP